MEAPPKHKRFKEISNYEPENDVENEPLTCAVVIGEITTLEHELRDHTVESGVLVPQSLSRSTLLASAKSSVNVRNTLLF